MEPGAPPPRDGDADRAGRPSTPRWVKVFGAVVVALLLVLLVLHLTGNSVGPGMHGAPQGQTGTPHVGSVPLVRPNAGVL